MKQEKIRKLILDITKGNLRYADPQDDICKEATARYDKDKVGQEGYTIQSAEEALEDIIVDLRGLQSELQIKKANYRPNGFSLEEAIKDNQ
jgi:predicted  nucleic acid-binding Zn-ribbon protein